MTYIKHIDGLRAIAVLGVVFFHYDFKIFQGGFVGVDIFFVISGFLITNLIYKEIRETNSFNVSRFYGRRVKRLAPSLLATIILVFMSGLVLFTSEQLISMGYEMISGLLSIANLFFWTQSGYFDVATETKPLLHLWSLSVEEQFYFVWPFILLLSHKLFKSQSLLIAVLVVFTLSLLTSIILTRVDLYWFKNQLSGIFYLTPFRAYEFMVGAIGVLIIKKMPSSRHISELTFIVGFIGLFYSLCFFDEHVQFPYYSALLPCISTLLVILSSRSKLSKLLLENRLSVSIGLISYTLYLIHWPVIVFAKYLALDDLTYLQTLIAVILTAAISIFIHRFIETPLRNLKPFNQEKTLHKSLFTGCVVISLGITATGTVLILSKGFQNIKNEPFPYETVLEGKENRLSLTKSACRIAKLDKANCDLSKDTQVLIFGNSHEPDGFNIIKRVTQGNNLVNLIVFGATNQCNMIVDPIKGSVHSDIKRRNCKERVSKLNDHEFIKSIDVLVYSSNKPFAGNKRTDWRLLRLFKQLNPDLNLLVLGTYFNTKHECVELANRFGDTDSCKQNKYLSHNGAAEENSKITNELTKDTSFYYFSKFDALCQKNSSGYTNCITHANGEPMFYDRHHLSLGLSTLIGEKFLKIYTNELRTMKLAN